MGKIIVIGSSNTDMVFRSEKIPAAGETVMGIDFAVVQGGKGANQAVAAARADAEVVFIAKIGPDAFGSQAIAGYKNDNINTNYIRIDPNSPTGVAAIMVNALTGQNSIIVAPGANNNLLPEDIQFAEDALKDASIMLLQLEVPLKTVLFALGAGKMFGLKTILNPAPAQKLPKELLALTDIITPNETETEILTGILPNSIEFAQKAAKALLTVVNEAVVITMGSKGVFYMQKNGTHGYLPAEKVDTVDTTAAGDVFNGYFAAALTNGVDFVNAIEMANQAAALSVTKKGAQTSIPYISEVLAF